MESKDKRTKGLGRKKVFQKIFTVGTLHKNIIWKGENSKKIVYPSGKWVLTANGFMDFQDPDQRIFGTS